MTELTLLDGTRKPLATDTLRAALGDALLTPESPGYDRARALWNAMIDRRPGLIVEARDEADVVAAVTFAGEHGVLLSVRGAGHNIAGNAACDGGIMLSFERMKAVTVDPESGIARVQPGATLADVDAATQAHGRAIPTGINSTTGIAGLTLGGGFGWLSRMYGLTIDSLISARVVTADGRLVTASEDENADLFWGLRGGGGNFGVVTSFEFRTWPVGPEVLSGLIVHPWADVGPTLRAYREYLRDVPDEVTVWAVLRKAPPLPFLPEEVHGTEVLVLAAFHAGGMAEGEKALAPLRAIGNPIADVVGPHPYAGWQQAFDPLLTPGERNYWKTHDFAELSDALLDTVVEYVESLPDPQSEVFFGQLGGAQARIAEDATAYPGRNAAFVMNVHGRWSDPAQDDASIAWCRGLWSDAAPHAMGEAYVNFMTDDEGDRVEAAYGSRYSRLVALKNRWDPGNLFRMNQNVPPTV